jgi:hypothetical protein
MIRGGEHEDYYDPDFHIYNDVVVFGPEDKIEMYDYPKEVFPSTDFHTANPVGDKIIVIACLGNVEDRRPGFTLVYSVDTKSYHISGGWRRLRIGSRSTGERPCSARI